MNIHALLDDLMRSNFFGNVEIPFESGRITLVKKTESIKFSNNSPNNRQSRGNNDHDRNR